jgi:hypothetical protein
MAGGSRPALLEAGTVTEGQQQQGGRAMWDGIGETELGQWCDCCSRTMPRGCVSRGGDRDGVAVPSACCRCHQKAPGVDGDDCELCEELERLTGEPREPEHDDGFEQDAYDRAGDR